MILEYFKIALVSCSCSANTFFSVFVYFISSPFPSPHRHLKCVFLFEQQKCLASQFWELDVSRRGRVEPVPAAYWLPAVVGSPWLTSASVQFLLLSSHGVLPVCHQLPSGLSQMFKFLLFMWISVILY